MRSPRLLLDAVSRFLDRWKWPIRIIWIAAVLALIVAQLWRIGPAALAADVPKNPLFYLVYWCSFCVLPLSEMMIFRRIWPQVAGAPFSVLLRKRALNAMVVSYSGDLFFFWWVRSRRDLAERRVLAGIKDSSVLSAVASGLLNAAVAAAFFLSGSAAVIDRVLAGHRSSLYAGLAILALLVPVLLRFRKRVLWIDGGQATGVFAIHLARNVAVLLLQLLQWWIVLPQVPLQTWLLFLTLQMLVSNLPLLPSRDFIFLAVAVGMVGSTGVDQSALAAMLVVMTFLKQMTNLVALLVTSVLPGERGPTAEEEAYLATAATSARDQPPPSA